jgi:hypothetical protein
MRPSPKRAKRNTENVRGASPQPGPSSAPNYDRGASPQPGPSSAPNYAPIADESATQNVSSYFSFFFKNFVFNCIYLIIYFFYLQTTSAEPMTPLATSTPKQQNSGACDDAVLNASTIQLNASITEPEDSEEDNFEIDSSPLRDMSSEWSLTSISSPEEEEEAASDRGVRRRLDMSLVSSSDDDSSDMEFLLTREQRFMRDFVDLVSFCY